MNSCKIVTLIRVQTVSLWPWLPLHIGSWALQPQESLIVLLISGKKTFQTLCTFFFNHKLGINSFWKWIIPVRFQFGGNWCLDTTVGILKAIVDPCSFFWWTTNAWESPATHRPNTHTFFFFLLWCFGEKRHHKVISVLPNQDQDQGFFPSHFSVISVALFFSNQKSWSPTTRLTVYLQCMVSSAAILISETRAGFFLFCQGVAWGPHCIVLIFH